MFQETGSGPGAASGRPYGGPGHHVRGGAVSRGNYRVPARRREHARIGSRSVVRWHFRPGINRRLRNPVKKGGTPAKRRPAFGRYGRRKEKEREGNYRTRSLGRVVRRTRIGLVEILVGVPTISRAPKELK